jgi:hypothetical protein
MRLDGAAVGRPRVTEDSRLPLSANGVPLSTVLDNRERRSPHERVVRVDLRTVQGGTRSTATRVYVYVPADRPARVVGLRRR